jgi:hypothetical protein
MKNFYYAVNTEDNGKIYAFVIKASINENLKTLFSGYKNLISINACETKKRAEELANFWNECYKANGTYMF